MDINELKDRMIKDGCYRKDGYLKPQWVQTAENKYDLSGIPGNSLSEKLYVILRNNGEQDKCIVCGKPARYHDFAKGYYKTCGNECKLIVDRNNISFIRGLGSTPEAIAKARQTNIERYGTAFPMQNEKVKQKAKDSCEEKYGEGITNPFQAKEVKEKIQTSMVAHFGVQNPSFSPELRKKIFARNFKMTKPEALYKEYLESHNYDFKYEYDYNGKNFDFAIFKEGKLDTLIEIDGELFHGLIKDRDNKHSQGHTDYKRFRILDNNIKLIVIDSEKVKKSFSEFEKIYNQSYDEYIEEMKENILSIKDFPYYNFSEKRLRGDYKGLCNFNEIKSFRITKSHVGQSSILYFCRSLFSISENNLPSIVEAWQDKELINRLIGERYLYYSEFSSHSVLDGFKDYPYVYRKEIISPSLIRYIIKKYVDDNSIFDPNSCPSILLAAASLGKNYTTICKDSVLKNELEEMIKFHNIETVNFIDSTKEVSTLITEIKDEKEIDFIINSYNAKKYLFLINKESNQAVETFSTDLDDKNKNLSIIIIDGRS